MASELAGREVAFLVAMEGAEQVELTGPWQAVQEAGGRPVLVAPEAGEVQAFNHLDKGDRFPVDLTVDRAEVGRFVGLVLPGGVANPDQLRTVPAAVAFIKDFFQAGKPVAAICHAPWALVEAAAVDGRTLTSWPSVQTDIRNAGGTWVDEQVFSCSAGPNVLVTSRKPDDIPAFCDEFVKVFAASGDHTPS